ncbi:MAG TPA: phosphoglycerate dehydrogenase [Pirellulaceae bacterium]|nr:phosphoglycerate dehydrogenase [Pirellulaceae bacterium]
MHRIVVLDPISPEGLELLKNAPGVTYDVRLAPDGKGLKGEELRTVLAEYDGAICRSGVKITAESLEGNRKLKAIVRAGVGVDNIDRVAATRLGIIVMNTPTGNTISTAEHAMTLMLALSRKVAPAFASLKAGKWDRNSYMGTQLAEKTLGIIGCGRIGQEVAKRAVAFQMRVLGFDPFLSPEQAQKLGIERVEKIADMLPRLDYLTVHTPPTPEPLIGKKELSLLKKGVRLINCARGGIYDEAALVEGLQSGQIGGVALDVYEKEPCTDSPLYQMNNVLCTPHLGASTEEAQTQVAVEAVQLLVNYLTTGEIRHAVNMASVDPKTLDAMRGYLDVAHRLGLLLASWQNGSVASCALEYRGDIAQKDTKLITAAFCAGLLERALEESVNVVNAEVLLRERGIQLSVESRTDPGAFSSSITASITSDGQVYLAGGTLFGNNMPRLFRLRDFRLEAYLDGNLLIFTHDDVPGIIGRVGTIFGEHGVNIAQMAVGRANASGKAIGVLNIDSLPPQVALDALLAHPHIHSVKVIEMPPAGQLPTWLS